MGLWRRGNHQPVIELAAGDTIVCLPDLEYLGIVRPNGTDVDLNQLQIQFGSSHFCKSLTGQFGPGHIMQLAGVLAVCYGLICNEAIMLTRGGSACPIRQLGDDSAGDELPPGVLTFLNNLAPASR